MSITRILRRLNRRNIPTITRRNITHSLSHIRVLLPNTNRRRNRHRTRHRLTSSQLSRRALNTLNNLVALSGNPVINPNISQINQTRVHHLIGDLHIRTRLNSNTRSLIGILTIDELGDLQRRNISMPLIRRSRHRRRNIPTITRRRSPLSSSHIHMMLTSSRRRNSRSKHHNLTRLQRTIKRHHLTINSPLLLRNLNLISSHHIIRHRHITQRSLTSIGDLKRHIHIRTRLNNHRRISLSIRTIDHLHQRQTRLTRRRVRRRHARIVVVRAVGVTLHGDAVEQASARGPSTCGVTFTHGSPVDTLHISSA